MQHPQHLASTTDFENCKPKHQNMPTKNKGEIPLNRKITAIISFKLEDNEKFKLL